MVFVNKFADTIFFMYLCRQIDICMYYESNGIEKFGASLFYVVLMLFCVLFFNVFVVLVTYLCATIQFGRMCIAHGPYVKALELSNGEKFFLLSNPEFGDTYMRIGYDTACLIVIGAVIFLCIYLALRCPYKENDNKTIAILPTETWGWLVITLTSAVYLTFEASKMYVSLFERRMNCTIDKPLAMPIIISIAICAALITIVIRYSSIKGILVHKTVTR